ncbi:unnamed protein product, partial [Ixodes hexagonus]
LLFLGLTKSGFSEKPVFSTFIAEDNTQGTFPCAPGDLILMSSGSAHVIGWATFSRIYSTWEGKSLRLDDIYVVPDHRRTGVGSALLRTVVEVCRAMGCQRIDCCPTAENQGLTRLLQKHGGTDLNKDGGWSLYQLGPDCVRKLEQRQ